MNCYCNSGKDFNTCCKPIIRGIAKAETAEQLMRSRYSAFVIADINYLLKSHHQSTRPTKERKQILNWTKSVRWIGLVIVSTQKGQPGDHDGFVEFKATYLDNGQLGCIHEKSYFVKEQDTWFYQSGQHF